MTYAAMPPPAGAPPKPVRAVVFDFGGVLITPITTGVSRLAERHGVDHAGDARGAARPRRDRRPPVAPGRAGRAGRRRHPGRARPTTPPRPGSTLAGDEIDVLLVPALRGQRRRSSTAIALAAASRHQDRAADEHVRRVPSDAGARTSTSTMFDAVVESYAVGGPQAGAGDLRGRRRPRSASPTTRSCTSTTSPRTWPRRRRSGWRTVSRDVTDSGSTALAELRPAICDAPGGRYGWTETNRLVNTERMTSTETGRPAPPASPTRSCSTPTPTRFPTCCAWSRRGTSATTTSPMSATRRASGTAARSSGSGGGCGSSPAARSTSPSPATTSSTRSPSCRSS